MGRLHKLQLERAFADALHDGSMGFIVRMNSEGFNAGDTVEFSVPKHYFDGWQEKSRPHAVEGNSYEITYVLSGKGICEGYVVIGLRKKTSCKQCLPNFVESCIGGPMWFQGNEKSNDKTMERN